MKQENIRFSVLVPVYQAEKYLEECIQSVLHQTYQNWELILVNDGSTDRSGEICDRYAEKYDRIHAYHKENVGTLHTRRVGIAKATGDYYVFLDADDLLKENALAVIYEKIIEHGSDCIVYGYERFCENEILGKTETEPEELISDRKKLYEKVFLSRGIGYYDMLIRKAVKVSVVGKRDYSDYYHIVLGEDDLQSLEIWAECEKALFIDDVLYSYRMNPDSVMHSINFARCKDGMTVRKVIFEELYDSGLFEEENLDTFRKYWMSEASSHLVTIASCPASFKAKMQYLDEIRNGKVYECFVKAGIQEKWKKGIKATVVLSLFSKKKYGILIRLSSFYRKLRKNIK